MRGFLLIGPFPKIILCCSNCLAGVKSIRADVECVLTCSKIHTQPTQPRPRREATGDIFPPPLPFGFPLMYIHIQPVLHALPVVILGIACRGWRCDFLDDSPESPQHICKALTGNHALKIGTESECCIEISRFPGRKQLFHTPGVCIYGELWAKFESQCPEPGA